MNGRSNLVVLGAVCCLLSSGCGGSGGGGAPGGGGGGTPDSRGVLFSSVEAKLESFSGADKVQENQQMLAFLQSKPEFTETGLTADGAWGQFADGSRLMVCNNVDASEETRSAHVGLTRSLARRAQRSRGEEGGIPSTGNVMLATSFGSFFEAFSLPISDMFSSQVYTPGEASASVEALKAINDVCVLYIFGHGGAFPIVKGGGPVYNVWTSTVRAKDGSTDGPYSADLHDGTMSYFTSLAYLSNNDPKKPVVQRAQTHYSITSKFVTKYWTGKFNKDSLVFMNTCSSATPDAIEFELACLNAGASVYLGWNERMRLGEAISSAAFLFDRMLGTNSPQIGTAFKETPPQRAFSIVEVLGEMSTRKRPNIDLPLDTTVAPPMHPGDPPVDAKLTLMSLNQRFNQLAPSIHDLSVNEQKDELAINGYFGSVMGSVKMGDSRLKIKSWVPETIICELPRTGPASAGEVIVYNDAGHYSNTAPLTAWDGTATYTVEEAGSLKMVMTFNFRFRGDVHGYRSAPGEKPTDPGLAYSHCLTTKGTYAFSGAFDTATYHEDWSGSGPMKARIDGVTLDTDNTINCVGGIVDSKWDMVVLAFAHKGNHVHTFSRDSKGVVFGEGTHDADGFGVANFPPPGAPFQAAVPANFTIPGVKRTMLVDSNYAPGTKATYTLEWSAFPATAAPTADTTRSARSGRSR